MGYGIINANLALLAVGPPPVNDVGVGPFLSLPSQFIIGNNYNIKARLITVVNRSQIVVLALFNELSA